MQELYARALLLALSTVALGAWVILVQRFTFGLRAAPTLTGTTLTREIGGVTAIVPARNEEPRISRCIQSLLAQPEIGHIVVVDDSSTDGTASAVKKFQDDRIQLLSVSPPPGWTGKSFACYWGASHSQSDLLLFVDADTILAPGAVSSALALMRTRNLSAVSAVGELRCATLWDKVATPFMFGLLNSFIKMGDVARPDRHAGYLYGSFILVSARAYIDIGGHKSVRSELVEDRALGRLLKDRGHRIEIARAGKLVSAEWAPGFRKSLNALGRISIQPLKRNRKYGLGFVFALTMLFALPFAALVGAFTSGTDFRLLFAITAGGSFVCTLTMCIISAKLIGSSTLCSLLFPLPEIVMAAVFWATLLRPPRSSKVIWNGRIYQRIEREIQDCTHGEEARACRLGIDRS